MEPNLIGANMRNPAVDHDWLALLREDVLDPDQRIVDSHHHLWDRPGWRYLPPDLLMDMGDGHNVIATIHVEDDAGYRSYGPEAMRAVGETEIMAGLGRAWTEDPSAPQINAGIVGYADLFLGAAVGPVLDAHIEVGRGRFRGIRQITAWDADLSVQTPLGPSRRALVEGMLGDSRFHEGFRQLARLGLCFDAWLYHPQIAELGALADRFPQVPIILNHIGGVVRVGAYKGRDDAVFAAWRKSISELAMRRNVTVKIGGMGMQIFGFNLRDSARPLSSLELAEAWRPFVDHCIEVFGPERCMFESNFPVDMAFFSYRTLWNAFKRLSSGASREEKDMLFYVTAAKTYKIDLPSA